MAKTNFIKMRKLLCDKSFNLQRRYNFVKCYLMLHSILLCGVEFWILKTSTMNELKALEMWMYRRMLQKPWTSHTANVESLRNTT